MNYYLFLVIVIIIITIIIFFIGYYLFNYEITIPYEFPIFQSRAELNSSVWKNYIQNVYKDLPTDGNNNFPLDLSNFSVLYTAELSSTGIDLGSNIYNNFCTAQSNTLTNNLNWAATASGQIWLRKLPPFTCLKNNTYVEIFHSAGDPIGDGSWMYATPGSGIWFDVGNTICFKKHTEAISFFLNRECENPEADFCDAEFGDMITAANNSGYKSIQFTEHGDQVCGLRAMEIVHVQGTGFYSCGFNPDSSNFGTCVFNTYKTGWNNSIGCSCDSTRININCNLSA